MFCAILLGMTDTKERNKLQDLENALSEFHTQLEQRNEKLTEIREHFPELRDKANILRARLQEELERRGHKFSLQVTTRQMTSEEVKNEPEISQLSFQNGEPQFPKFWALEVTHTKIQFVHPKEAVIYTEYFPVIDVGDSKISEFLENIKKVDGVIPYLNGILEIKLEDILESMNRDATPVVQANLEELKKNS